MLGLYLFAFLALSTFPSSLAACKEYTMLLEQKHLDPCPSFNVKGRGCFGTSLQRDIAIETYRWTIYERYKEIFLESRKSNTYGKLAWATFLCPKVEINS